MIGRQSPVTVLPGVGKVRAANYEKLGVATLGDLLTLYPRAYEDRSDLRPLSEARTDGKTALLLTVAGEARTVRLRSHKSFLKFRAFDDSASCEIVYFNQDYLAQVFRVGAVFRFWGKVERKGKKYVMSSPVAEPWVPGVRLPPLTAVYRLTAGLTQKQIAKDVAAALDLLAEERYDPLPEEIRAERGLIPLWEAERRIHFPESEEDLDRARRRMVYQEFFDFSVRMAALRDRSCAPPAPVCPAVDLAPFTDRLPYRLTAAQERVIGEIRSDLARPVAMSRMVVGDVGCGKTVCAAAAIWTVVRAGRQAALMAPTEILARQHDRDLRELFSGMGIRVELLIGATPAAEKRRIRRALLSEDPAARCDLVIGTHALLSEGVALADPGLVVTDEQHRFGASQRALLSDRNGNVHLLVMSATPIPRSLALILYGDLDLSRVDEMPPGRQQVDTYVVDEGYRDRLNGFIRRQIADGGQVYVVCPAVEERENEPGEVGFDELFGGERADDRPPLKAAVTYAAELAELFPETRVAFLHGRCKSGEKDRVMREFADGEIGILVSTTVIEVGVNVPNACLMVVENAERFGLAQLHQLRGRVGRGTRRSYCILVSGAPSERLGERSRERLEVMRATHDGYEIAERDLAQRGPGDFFRSAEGNGIRQSGEPTFRLGTIAGDADLLTAAAEDASRLAPRGAPTDRGLIS